MKSNRTKPKQILIVGSAGFIGKALMRKISQLGRPAYSLYHAHLPEPLNHITPVFADLLRPEQLDTYVKQADEVIYLAWSNTLRGNKNAATPNNDSANVVMLRNLIASMEAQETKRLIFVSSLGASRYATSYYLQEKYLAETVVLNSSIPEKIILRSSLVYSDLSAKDKFVQSIESLMTLPWVYPVPRFEQKIAPLHVQDLVEVLVKLIDIPLTSPAQLLEISGEESLALDEIFKSVSTGIGKGNHIALKGFIGDALTPLFEKLHGRKRFEGPSLRDLLTVATKKDDAMEPNNPILEKMPHFAHRFDEAMGKPKSPLLN
ncbi:MAG: NAD-dependent epimerase/dehydratase family protein [Chitinophagaceae bacterium]|nr:NAD-dependent epimerase/dehydratase family protein [Oligoflexus sp.]